VRCNGTRCGNRPWTPGPSGEVPPQPVEAGRTSGAPWSCAGQLSGCTGRAHPRSCRRGRTAPHTPRRHGLRTGCSPVHERASGRSPARRTAARRTRRRGHGAERRRRHRGLRARRSAGGGGRTVRRDALRTPARCGAGRGSGGRIAALPRCSLRDVDGGAHRPSVAGSCRRTGRATTGHRGSGRGVHLRSRGPGPTVARRVLTRSARSGAGPVPVRRGHPRRARRGHRGTGGIDSPGLHGRFRRGVLRAARTAPRSRGPAVPVGMVEGGRRSRAQVRRHPHRRPRVR